MTVLQISNFEYLMQLNTLAGRSYNDITQVCSFWWCPIIEHEIETINAYNDLIRFIYSILYSRGYFLITAHRVWTYQILPLSEICQRWDFFYSIYKHKSLLTFMWRCKLQPIGALNPERLQKYQERYSSFDDPVIPKFHYGSHYSTAGTVGSLFIHSPFYMCNCGNLQSYNYDI